MLEFEKPKKRNKDFALECLMILIKGANAKNIVISAEETVRIVDENKFNPTIKPPDVVFEKDEKYSVWLRPVFYYYSEGLKTLIPEIVIIRGKNSLYNIDKTTEKMMSTYEFLTSRTANELSTRLLSRKNNIHLLVFARDEFKPSDLVELKQAFFFLSPKKMLVVSKEYLPEAVKANLPVGVVIVENLGINKGKLKEKAFELI